MRGVLITNYRRRTSSFSRRVLFASEFCQSHAHEKPLAFRVERREAPGSWATPRGRMLPPAHASGVARATERSACANRLLRARGASRRSTAALVEDGRPSSPKTALAPPSGLPPEGVLR